VVPEPSRDPALVADLRALGASVAAAGEDSVALLTDGVMARLAAPAPASPPPWRERVGAFLARRRRRLAVAVVVVVLALTGVPAVRAAVADWFGFGGVRVRLEPGAPATPSPSPSPSAPPSVPAAAVGSVAAAREQVRFDVLVPGALGPPSGVEVSADRRVVSMSWTVPGAGVVRLDQFDGRLDYTFAKTAPGVEFTTVGGDFAMWFDRPHQVQWLAAGVPEQPRSSPPRLAGRTLIWQAGETTLRLEGDLDLPRAREIADSAGNP
jgi:hypothetical protein